MAETQNINKHTMEERNNIRTLPSFCSLQSISLLFIIIVSAIIRLDEPFVCIIANDEITRGNEKKISISTSSKAHTHTFVSHTKNYLCHCRLEKLISPVSKSTQR